MPAISKIDVKKTDLVNLLYEVAKVGKIRIPHFQRDYVWERTKVRDLFDSIYKQFPIGSIFLWITPREYSKLYKEIPGLQLPEPPPYEQIKMVLDGQQRITSLFCAAYGKQLVMDNGVIRDYRKICFDLDSKEFVVAPRSEDKTRIIAVWRFFNDDGEYEIYDALTPERRISFQECKRIINTYPISVIEIEDKDLEEAIEIFERINQGGKRLSLFDLVVASTWTTTFDLKLKTDELNSHLQKIGFGKISEEVVAQTISLVLHDQCTRSFQLQLSSNEVIINWKDVSDGIKLTVDFLRQNLGVEIYDFIPYPSMIAMISYLFIKLKTRSLSNTQAEFVKDWFWQSSFSQRYSSSTLTTMGQDIASYFKPLAEGKEVSSAILVTITPEDIKKLQMHRRSAVRNAILCILARNKPQHFENASEIILDNNICSEYNDSEKHHIFPKSFLKKINKSNIHLLANFTFIPAELNKDISGSQPSNYFKRFQASNSHFEETMKSHLIPSFDDSGIWVDNYESFIKQRSEKLFQEIRKLIKNSTDIEVMMQEEPEKALNILEEMLRKYIDIKLTNAYTKDYWKHVSQGVKERVQMKVKQRIRKQPMEIGNEADNLVRLSFCDVMDYCEIILVNWTVFESDFGAKPEVEKHCLNLKEYRNPIKHYRDMNNVERKQGEASMEWIYLIIQRYFTTKPVEDEFVDETESPDNKYLYCQGSHVIAKGVLGGDGKSITVIKGSGVEKQSTESFLLHHYKNLKDDLINKNILLEKNDIYEFANDYIFSSTSAAAAVILGRSANGLIDWKNEAGTPLSDLKNEDN